MIRLGYLKLKNDFNVEDENLQKLSHINLSFGKVVDIDGTVEFDIIDEAKYWQLKEKCPTTIFTLAIGGWGAGNFSEAASTEHSRQRFVSTTMDIVLKYELNGVDLDWEYPCVGDSGISSSPDDKVNFTLLMEELRRALDNQGQCDGKEYILTFAAGANDKLVGCVELAKLAKITDFMNLMTYDMGGSFGISGHHASLYPSDICDKPGGAYFVDLYSKSGYPKEKIVLGAAFYGRGGNKVDGINKKYHGEEGLYFDYHDVLQLIAENKTTLYIDDKAKAAYTYDGNTFITIETEDSIASKVEYCQSNNLAGIMFWEYATDNTGTLLNVLVNHGA